MLAADTARLCYNASPLSGACTFLNSQLHDVRDLLLHGSAAWGVSVEEFWLLHSPGPSFAPCADVTAAGGLHTSHHQNNLHYGEGETIWEGSELSKAL